MEIIYSKKLQKLVDEIQKSGIDIMDILDQVNFYWDYTQSGQLRMELSLC